MMVTLVLFHAHEYVFIFLPVVVVVYYLIGQNIYSKIWLLLSSLFFYGWWNPAFLPLLLASIAGNYTLGMALVRRPSRLLLSLGIAANLAVIGHYKYFNFYLKIHSALSDAPYEPLSILLPLAISFYTFQQIAFLVDAYRQKIVHKEFIHYAMFVTFFPHLIAGPILNHKTMIVQFAALKKKAIDYDWIARGIFVFSIGLFKVLVIAQPLSLLVDMGYANVGSLSMLEAWVTGVAFLMQIYFDFSAYADMAIGSALMLGFVLPDNFNSPYRTRNIILFWQRWNITLGKFFLDYFYIPACGKHAPEWRRNIMLIVTFLLIGLWHGADWTFVLFGISNGIAMVIVRICGKFTFRLPFVISWLLNILFLLFIAILFRASDVTQAVSIYSHMFNSDISHIFNYSLPHRDFLPGLSFTSALWSLPLAILVCVWPYNSTYLRQSFRPEKPYLLATIGLILCAVIKMSSAQAFIYFQF